jgi:diketogulonate reductase-like aldo/keto reductase
MQDLVAAGKVRAFGVSNFDADELKEAIDAVGPGRIASNQVLYNLGHRGIEWDLIPFCRQHHIAVVGYTPFGGMPARRGKGLQTLETVAARHGRTPSQVVLRFLTRDPIAFTIPKAVDPAHVRENAGGDGFELTARDLAEIDAAFPPPQRKVALATA